VERVDLFVKSISDWELPWYCPNQDPKGPWPSHGHIKVDKLCVGYRKGPDVIKSLTLEILPQDKIGVVGRTGSGKSTFLRVLLRLTEPRSGSIVIDGVNIANIGLSVLRSHLGIIPQEPVLFFETIRYNLDPFGKYSDAEIFETLDLVGLGDFVRGMSLDYTVSEAGANFSQGQRQLLCVVRALLRKTKILLLDEPSASIDQASDQVLQRTIRTAFVHCTTITVAHRLSSIADSDKIVVLSHGDLVEFDHPHVLLSNKDGHLRGMVNVLEDTERRLCETMAMNAYQKVLQAKPAEGSSEPAETPAQGDANGQETNV
jgi:ABC-type multidrug transport system fused ATPase/permease subunit